VTDTTDRETNERTNKRTDGRTPFAVRLLDGVWHLRVEKWDQGRLRLVVSCERDVFFAGRSDFSFRRHA